MIGVIADMNIHHCTLLSILILITFCDLYIHLLTNCEFLHLNTPFHTHIPITGHHNCSLAYCQARVSRDVTLCMDTTLIVDREQHMTRIVHILANHIIPVFTIHPITEHCLSITPQSHHSIVNGSSISL